MTTATGMWAVLYGPTTNERDEPAEARAAPPFPPPNPLPTHFTPPVLLQAERREKVVAEEEGCMLYQLVRNSEGQYFGLELFRSSPRAHSLKPTWLDPKRLSLTMQERPGRAAAAGGRSTRI